MYAALLVATLALPLSVWAIAFAAPSIWRNADRGLERGLTVGYTVCLGVVVLGLGISMLDAALAAYLGG